MAKIRKGNFVVKFRIVKFSPRYILTTEALEGHFTYMLVIFVILLITFYLLGHLSHTIDLWVGVRRRPSFVNI